MEVREKSISHNKNMSHKSLFQGIPPQWMTSASTLTSVLTSDAWNTSGTTSWLTSSTTTAQTFLGARVTTASTAWFSTIYWATGTVTTVNGVSHWTEWSTQALYYTSTNTSWTIYPIANTSWSTSQSASRQTSGVTSVSYNSNWYTTTSWYTGG